MLWMGIWVRTYAVLHVLVGVKFRENGVWPSLYDVAVSCLRLQTPIDCIPLLYWMYTKCFSTLRCWGWAYGYTLMPYYMCRWGWVLVGKKMGQWLSPSDVVRSWLRLQIPRDWYVFLRFSPLQAHPRLVRYYVFSVRTRFWACGSNVINWCRDFTLNTILL